MDEKERLANAITKGLAYAENGGKLNLGNTKAGKTGEMKSIFQFTPNTWKQYAKEVTGDENLPLDNDHETYIVREKVKKWIDKGYNASQIASMWNAGEAKPDAYKQNWKGVNKKYGVAFDTPKYAKSVVDYSKQFYTDKGMTNVDTSGKALQAQKRPSNEPLDNILKIINEADSRTKSTVKDNALVAGLISPQV